MRPHRAWLTGLLTVVGCSGDATIRLPDRPDAELGFAVLYEGARVAAIGPVASSAVIYSGSYQVEANTTGLEVRVFFVRWEDLRVGAERACDTLSNAASQVACRAPIERCEAEPSLCLGLAKAAEGCGDRVPLPEPLSAQGYLSQEGNLTATSGGPEGTVYCGPVVQPGCPIVVPGYSITEDGHFRCVAPTAQLGCELSIDLSRCGLNRVEGTLTSVGVLEQRGSTDCQVVPLSEQATTYSQAPGFALRCEDRNLVASGMGLLFAEAGCPRRGPSIFYAFRGRYRGISGLLPVVQAGRPPKLAFSGSGIDDCRLTGCRLQGQGCESGCGQSCKMDFYIDECASNSWAACTGMEQREECYQSCVSACQRDPDGTCSSLAFGGMLTVGAADVPERDAHRLNVGGGASGTAALLQGARSNELLLATDRAAILVDRAGDDELTELGRLDLGFSLAGAIAIDPEHTYFFGNTDAAARIQRVIQVAEAPFLSAEPPIELPSLAEIDGAAAFGRTQEWLAVYQKSAATPSLWLVPKDGGSPIALPLPGAPTSIVALPGGAVVLGVHGEDAHHSLVRIAPDPSTLATVTTHPLILGLEATSLALDPVSCAGSQPVACRVLLGLARTERPGPPLLGVALENSVASAAFAITPALVELPLLEVDLLRAIPNTLYAVSSRQNGVLAVTLRQ